MLGGNEPFQVVAMVKLKNPFVSRPPQEPLRLAVDIQQAITNSYFPQPIVPAESKLRP
jgi:hypothetical protein